MPIKVKPLTHILVDTNIPPEYKGISLGSFADIENEQTLLNYYPDDATYPNLPYRRYWIYAPAAHGRVLRELGNRHLVNCDADNRFILTNVLLDQFDVNKEKIKSIIESNGVVRQYIIQLLYQNFSNQYNMNWVSHKAAILTKFKPIISELVSFGARIDHLDDDPELFNNLVEYGLDGKALTNLLSCVHYTNNPNSFYEFEQLVNQLLPKGADINAIRDNNPDFGTFLHYYMAFELPHAVNLIRFLESKRSIKANTQFNYELRDGFGHTPLLVALLTRNEKAALALVNLAAKNIKVGIDIADKEGISPLLIAAALGMDEVVKALISKGANVQAKDRLGRGLEHYVRLDRAEVFSLLSRFMNPLRSNVKNSHFHSELYCYDGSGNTTPICLYKEGQSEVIGQDQLPHVVVLSNYPPHKENQDLVVATLQAQVAKGDKWAKKNLPYVRKQIDEIRYCKKYDALIDCIYQRIGEGNKLAEELKSHVESLLPTPMLYKEILESTLNFLKDKIKQGHTDAAEMHADLKVVLDSTTEVDAVIDICIAGQDKVQAYIRSSEASKAMIPSKEKSLRRACALGQINVVRELMDTGVDCNARDHLGRSAFHFTVMRAPLVKNEFLKEAQERGEQDVLNVDNLVGDAMEMHPEILDCLMQNPSLDYEARNESKNTPMDVLTKDSKQTADLVSQRIAQKCLDKITAAQTTVKIIIAEPTVEVETLGCRS